MILIKALNNQLQLSSILIQGRSKLKLNFNIMIRIQRLYQLKRMQQSFLINQQQTFKSSYKLSNQFNEKYFLDGTKSLQSKNCYLFSRKKMPLSPKKLNQQLENRLNKIKKQKPSYNENDYKQLLTKIIIFGISGAILMKILQPLYEKGQNKQSLGSNQTAHTFIAEDKVREMMAAGLVLHHQLEVKRIISGIFPGIGSKQIICEFKESNGQIMKARLTNITNFLIFSENLPFDYKIKFSYPYRVYAMTPNFKLLINFIFYGVPLIGGSFLLWKYKPWKKLARFFQQGSGGQQFMDNKKIQAIKPENINTLFKDVAGMHEAKFQITEFVDFLKQPEKYSEMGAKVPKGALLTGPPGTGKTLLARACAGQAGVPFYYVSGSDFVQKYVGLGASRVRKLFDQAEKNSPSIIFIDQIDAIGKKRDSGPFANQERDNTLNQLLVRMDGFDSQNKVIIMGATNIKDTLDPALLRPGRFDRSVEIGLPNFQERKQILQVHLANVKFDPNMTIQEVANKISILTPGFSGAELANVCNEGAILAARDEKQFIQMDRFQKATERVMAGLEKRNLFSDQEKVMLSYYECGKAVVGWFTQGSDPIIKLSILPFSKAAKGYSHTIKDEMGLNTTQQLLGKVCFYLAGRAAEHHFKDYITTNGDADLKRAKRIISLLVTKFGMSQKLKHIAFPDIDFVRKPYSSKIQNIIDMQIERFTNQSKAKVQKLIEQKQDLVKKLQQKLIIQQTLNHNEIKQILGPRPFTQNQNYQKYIIEEQKSDDKRSLQGIQAMPIEQKKNQYAK